MNKVKIGRDIGVDDMTVHNYFEILEDTMLGFFLPSYHKSIRKQQVVAPKFYLIDTGIKRALSNELSLVMQQDTYLYGDAFEHFIITEIYKRISYKRLEWKLFYARTRDGVEIDLIIERPGQDPLLVEIKSKTLVSAEDAKHLNSYGKELSPKSKRILLSQDPTKRIIDGCTAAHWDEGIDEMIGGSSSKHIKPLTM